MADRDARLLHAHAREGGKADDVAGGVDVGGARAVERVGVHVAAVVDGDAGGGEVEFVGVALASRGHQHAVGREGGAGVEHDLGRALVHGHALDLRVVVDADPESARHRGGERLRGVGIELLEQARARVDDGDLAAEGPEDAGVLGADHAAPHDDHARGDALEAQHRVGVDDDLVVEGKEVRAERGRSGGDEEDLAGDAAQRLAVRADLDRVRADESCESLNALDAVTLEVLVDALPFRLDDRALAVHEVGDGDVVLDRVVDAVEPALAEPGEVKGRFAQRLARDRARVHGGAARLGRPLDDADPLAEVRGLRGSFLAGGAAADDNEVEVVRMWKDVVAHAAGRSGADIAGRPVRASSR